MIWSAAWTCGGDPATTDSTRADARLPRAPPGRRHARVRRRRRQLHPRRDQPRRAGLVARQGRRLRPPLGHPGHQARPRRGAHPVGGRPTSGPTAAPAARCATTTRRCRRRSTTTRWRASTPTATSCCSRGRATPARSAGRSSGAATSPAARPSAPAPAPTSGCAAPSSASSAPPSWASPSGAPTSAATTSSRTARCSRAGSSSARSRGSWRSAAWARTRRGTCRPTPRYDHELIDIYRRYIQLRHALQPYIVAAAREAARGRADRAADALRRSARTARSRTCGTSTSSVPTCWWRPVWKVGQRQRTVYLPARHLAQLLGADPGVEGSAHHHRGRAARRHPGLRARRRRGAGTVSRAARLSRRSRCRAAATRSVPPG